MTIYLRNSKNQTVVDIEANIRDLHSVVNIETYSEILLEHAHDSSRNVIKDFDMISQLRGWFWEVYMEQTDHPTIKDLVSTLKEILIPIAEKYKLNYVTD